MCYTIDLNEEDVIRDIVSDGTLYNDHINKPCGEGALKHASDTLANDRTCTQNSRCVTASVNPHTSYPITANQQGGAITNADTHCLRNAWCIQPCTQTEDVISELDIHSCNSEKRNYSSSITEKGKDPAYYNDEGNDVYIGPSNHYQVCEGMTSLTNTYDNRQRHTSYGTGHFDPAYIC